jgi:hypothetical protein
MTNSPERIKELQKMVLDLLVNPEIEDEQRMEEKMEEDQDQK